MVHSFSYLPSTNIPRSKFRQVSTHKTAFDVDKLIPVFLQEVIPGDTFKIKATGFGRLATPIYPLMDNLYLDTFWFFVPHRLVWSNWKRFCGEQDDPGDSIDYTVPVCAATATTGYSEQSLFDYFGLPTKVPDYEHSALPLRGYNLIFNTWFRHEDIRSAKSVSTGDGPDNVVNYPVATRAKRYDYFTSCLPWPQKAPDGTVDLPLGTTAPVIGIAKVNGNFTLSSVSGTETGGTTPTYTYASYINNTTGSGDHEYYAEGTAATSGEPMIYADLTNATAATINQLRQAFQIQRLMERDARGGTRYIEILRSHFGIINAGGDARLQRPEYLGGSQDSIHVQSIPQTSESGTTPLGTLSAMGTVQLQTGFTRSFTEHGYVMCIANLRADITYSQGLDRHWTRQTRYDFYWPALSHIGEQAVPTIELYCQNPTTDTGSTGTPDNEKVFGYIGRYDEYRFAMSKITSVFRPNATSSLEAWHLSQEFTSLPTLNTSFIECATPLDRAIAVASEPHLILDMYVVNEAIRPMPMFGVPGMMDHF